MSRSRLFIVASLVLIATRPALGAPPADDAAPQGAGDGLSPEERAELERALGADSAAMDDSDVGPPTARPTGVAAVLQSLNPNLALILDATVSYFSAEPLQAGAHDPNHTGFTLQQLEMHLDANVDPFFRLDANIVFSPSEVELEEAYATSLDLPVGLQLRVGRFLTRFGRSNNTHPHTWHFVDQPLVNGKLFGGEGSRGTGLEVSWLTPLPWYVELVASATEAAGAETARSFYGEDDRGVSGLEDLLYTLALKQFFPLDDDWSLLWGLSTQLGPNPTGDGARSTLLGSDLHLRYRPLHHAGRTSVELTVEGMLRRREIPGDTLQDWGMFAELVWQIDAEWEVGARHDFVSGVANDPLDPDEDGPRNRTTLEVAFYPSHFARVRLQGAHDRPSWRDEPIWATSLALEVLIGAHGAHSY